MTSYAWNEPPDEVRAWGVFLASNAKNAAAHAAASPEFAEWVQEQRAARRPPFKGLRAELAVCEHGVCWGCADSDERTNCQSCEEAIQAEEEKRWAL